VQASVSVVIPTWNRATTLVAAIESAIGQSLPVLEVLVCDDGSTDCTEQVVASIAANDARVRWIPGARAGRPAIPRNRGILESRGEWLAFLDSDDTWLPDKLAVQMAAAQRLGCDAVCSNALRVASDGGSAPFLDSRAERLTLSDIARVNLIVCSSAVVNRKILQRTGGFPEEPELKAVEDYALWLRVATLTDFAYCAQPLVQYRDDPTASIRSEQALSVSAQRRGVIHSWQVWTQSAGLPLARRFAVHRQAMAERLRLHKARLTENLRKGRAST
jgi:teichuronic acid biosynthesis glycosyltransferase TuaG